MSEITINIDDNREPQIKIFYTDDLKSAYDIIPILADSISTLIHVASKEKDMTEQELLEKIRDRIAGNVFDNEFTGHVTKIQNDIIK